MSMVMPATACPLLLSPHDRHLPRDRGFPPTRPPRTPSQEDQWPGGDQDGYINAYAAAVRVLLNAVVAGTLDPRSVASITHLPERFVTLILAFLRESKESLRLFKTLERVVAEPYHYDYVAAVLVPVLWINSTAIARVNPTSRICLECSTSRRRRVTPTLIGTRAIWNGCISRGTAICLLNSKLIRSSPITCDIEFVAKR